MKINKIKVFDTQKIKNILKSKKLSKSKFCKDYNYSLSSLNSILNQKLGVGLDVVIILAKKLDIEIKELFKK